MFVISDPTSDSDSDLIFVYLLKLSLSSKYSRQSSSSSHNCILRKTPKFLVQLLGSVHFYRSAFFHLSLNKWWTFLSNVRRFQASKWFDRGCGFFVADDTSLFNEAFARRVKPSDPLFAREIDDGNAVRHFSGIWNRRGIFSAAAAEQGADTSICSSARLCRNFRTISHAKRSLALLSFALRVLRIRLIFFTLTSLRAS